MPDMEAIYLTPHTTTAWTPSLLSTDSVYVYDPSENKYCPSIHHNPAARGYGGKTPTCIAT